MSIGLQIFDKNGVLKLDTTDRILKLVESVTIYATGSYHVTELSKYFTYEGGVSVNNFGQIGTSGIFTGATSSSQVLGVPLMTFVDEMYPFSTVYSTDISKYKTETNNFIAIVSDFYFISQPYLYTGIRLQNRMDISNSFSVEYNGRLYFTLRYQFTQQNLPSGDNSIVRFGVNIYEY